MPRQAFRNCGCPYRGPHLESCRARRRRKPKKPAEYRPYRGTKAYRDMRKKIWDRDGGRCGRCDRLVGEGQPWDLGHIQPHAAGGEFVEENLRVEHAACNRRANG